MSDVFRHSGVTADARLRVADDAALPSVPFFVSLARFRAEREALLARGSDLGVILEPGDRLDEIAADLPALGALAVDFPKFGDGRGYSLARLARERHGYAGELRAVGDVLWDQIEAMERCGFDAFEVVHEPTRRRLERGEWPAFAGHYQPTGADRDTPLAGRHWAATRRR